MIRQMLNILVCPHDKESELELFEFSTRNIKKNIENKTESDKDIIRGNTIKNPEQNSINTGAKKENIDKMSADGDLDDNVVIEEGILFCNSCSRFYPIVEEIPIILPDNLRDKAKDLEILKKWSHSLPDKVIKNALPWHL